MPTEKLRIPVALRWSLVAAGVAGGAAALTLACSSPPETPTCVVLVDGSAGVTFVSEGGRCPDGDITVS